MYISHAASVFELKDSCIIKVISRGKETLEDVFAVKSIPCMLSNLNLLTNYSFVGPINHSNL